MRAFAIAAFFVAIGVTPAFTEPMTDKGTKATPGASAGAPAATPAGTPSMAPPKDAAAARADIKKTFGFIPGFLNQTPDAALPGAWAEFKGFQMNPDTVLPAKTKELIGLAVAAQIPCTYCIYAHTNFGKGAGATPQEIGEAVAMAASSRRWSTVLNGIQTDEATFRQDVAQWVASAKKMAGKPPSQPMELTDAESARRDIERAFGTVPEFLARYPDQAIVGAWREMRDVDMNPNSALKGKEKNLISLAVSSQIPCQFCIIADTEFAKLEGATEMEINEAIAMSAVTRHWSTMINGMQVDEAGFRKDIDRMMKGSQKGGKKQAMR